MIEQLFSDQLLKILTTSDDRVILSPDEKVSLIVSGAQTIRREIGNKTTVEACVLGDLTEVRAGFGGVSFQDKKERDHFLDACKLSEAIIAGDILSSQRRYIKAFYPEISLEGKFYGLTKLSMPLVSAVTLLSRSFEILGLDGRSLMDALAGFAHSEMFASEDKEDYKIRERSAIGFLIAQVGKS